jgi:hypothetical protein
MFISRKELQRLKKEIEVLNKLVDDLFRSQNILLDRLKLEFDEVPGTPKKTVLVKKGTILKRNEANAKYQSDYLSQLMAQQCASIYNSKYDPKLSGEGNEDTIK